MEFVLKIVFVLLLAGIAAIVAHFVDLARKKTSYDRMSFRETMDLCELPIVTFMNNGKKLNFLLDTGASKSVIHSGALDGLTYKNLDKSGDLYGIDGKRQDASFISMSIGYGGKDYSEEFQSVDMSIPFSNLKSDFGVNLHGILSSTFFQKYRYVLNFDELVAYSMV